MKRYLQIYKSFFRFSFSNFVTFRAYAINSMASTVAWGIFQFTWIQLLTIQTKSAFGWSKDELVILAIMYIIVIGIFHSLFTRNFDRFSTIIDRGELDFLLLKPIDSQFLATCFFIGYPNMLRALMGTGLLIFYTHLRHVYFTAPAILGCVVFVLFGIMLLYSLWLFYSTLLIWFPRLTNIIDFLYTINGIARYPREMIGEIRNFLLLFLLPFALTIATPVKVLVRGALGGDVAGLIAVALAMFVFTRFFWLFALRNYTSASS